MTSDLENQLYTIEIQRRALQKEANQSHAADLMVFSQVIAEFQAKCRKTPDIELWADNAMQHAANLVPRLQAIVNRNQANRQAFQDRAWTLAEAAGNIIRMLGWTPAEMKAWSDRILKEG